MKDIYTNRLQSYNTTRTLLEKPENKAIWFNQAPQRFTALTIEIYPLIDQMAALGASQSVTTVGSTAQQNVAQTSLVSAAATLGNALNQYYSDQGQIANADNWNMSASDWRRLREQALLSKATTLHDELAPLTSGSPAPGTDYGITTASVTAFSALVNNFADEIGKPGARRSSRKAETEAIPELDRTIREKFKAADKLAPQFGTVPNGSVFVDAYFNSREIIDLGHGPGDTPTPPTPPAPPSP